ncbi:uncharacterized protein [Primulina eburnea]|uniref:uncharacterized protein n=1 Tax=Primulina eburnea TaxID=1245227 RepID=UPI003C6C1AE9
MPPTSLTKKNAKFVWSGEFQKSFDILKQALISAPVLAMPLGQGNFVLHSDSSKLGYHLGKTNVVADALSQKVAGIAQLSVQRPLQSEIQRFGLEVYPKGRVPRLSNLTVKSDLLDRIRRGQLSDEHLQKWRLKDEAKGSVLYAVSNVIVRYRAMKRDIRRYVSEILTCQQAKAENQRPAGMLKPLPIPE